MRTALLALALAACSTPVPVAMTDGASPGGDAGDADYQCRTRCRPSAELCATNGCEWIAAADRDFCVSRCEVTCFHTENSLTCSTLGAWQCLDASGNTVADDFPSCTATR